MRLAFADGTRRSVRITAIDDNGFIHLDADGHATRAAWTDLDPAALLAAYPKVHDSDDPHRWLALGGLLSAMPDADRQAAIAFQRARRLDPDIATDAAIEHAKVTAAAPPHQHGLNETGPQAMGGQAGGVALGPDLASVDGAWPTLTPAEHAEATRALRDFAEPIVRRVAPGDWKQAETDYFLLYTDLDRDEALSWARLLDRMYDRMRAVFRVPEGQNVFKGRCLITIWSTRQRFAEWSRLAEGLSLAGRSGVAGYCRGFPDGRTHVTFFRQPDRMEFALVLTHEASHAFTHRYRTGRHIPSWVNEGLAEYVSHHLVEAPRWRAGRARGSREAYHAHGGLANLFVAPSIDWFQYGQAWEFTQMMVSENADGYRAFVDALKDGKAVHAALEEDYGASLDRLVRHYHEVYDRRGPANYIVP
jgi:hypothetical protein